MLPKNLRQNPGRVRAIIYAVLVHALVIGLAVIGFRWTVDSPSSDKVIQATAVPEPPASKPEDDRKRAQEEEQRKKAEAEQRRQEELRKKQEEELAQQRLVAERKKKEAEEKERQKRAAEEERRKEEKRRQQLSEQWVQEQLAAEAQARQQAAQAARAATAVDKYRALIRSRVSQSWNRPVGVAKGLRCVVKVRLAPGGKVLAAQVVRSSGNPVFDRSVENAVYKAEPLPLPEDPTLFDNFREIEFLFNPEE